MSDGRQAQLRARGFVLAEAAPPDAIAPREDWWIEDGVDRLFVGDVIRIRQGEPVVTGVGAHGQTIFEKKRLKGRKVKALVESVAYARVTSIGEKKGVRTAFYTLIASDSAKRKQTGGSLSQAAIVADNAEPVGRRQREVRRLRGSGPDDQVRSAQDPLQHALTARAQAFADMLRKTGGPGRHRLFQGDIRFGQDLAPVTQERVMLWVTGEERVPTWAMSALAEHMRLLGLPVDEAGAAYAPAPAPVEPPPSDEERDEEEVFPSSDRAVAFVDDEFGEVMEGDYLEAVEEDD